MSFTVAGVTGENGIVKVRFANDMAARVKLFVKCGCSPMELVELPKPMTKAEACQYLLDQGGVFAEYKDIIAQTMAKKVGAVAAPKVKAVKAKPTAVTKTASKVKAVSVKATKTQAKEDFEIEEIKEIAETV
jgi:hypothetical protein